MDFKNSKKYPVSNKRAQITRYPHIITMNCNNSNTCNNFFNFPTNKTRNAAMRRKPGFQRFNQVFM